MNARSLAAVLVVIAVLGVLFARGRRPDSGEGASGGAVGRLAQQRAETAWMTVDAVYGGIYDAGYVRYTATQLADLMVRTGNAAQAPDPAAYPPGTRAPQMKPVPYVIGRPTGPWQIVLVPYDDRAVVRVELYGNDVNTPLKTTDLAAR